MHAYTRTHAHTISDYDDAGERGGGLPGAGAVTIPAGRVRDQGCLSACVERVLMSMLLLLL